MARIGAQCQIMSHKKKWPQQLWGLCSSLTQALFMLGLCRGVVIEVRCPVCHAAGGVQPELPFYKPLVPGAPAHTGVGNEANRQVMWRFLWYIVQ